MNNNRTQQDSTKIHHFHPNYHNHLDEVIETHIPYSTTSNNVDTVEHNNSKFHISQSLFKSLQQSFPTTTLSVQPLRRSRHNSYSSNIEYNLRASNKIPCSRKLKKKPAFGDKVLSFRKQKEDAYKEYHGKMKQTQTKELVQLLKTVDNNLLLSSNDYHKFKTEMLSQFDCLSDTEIFNMISKRKLDIIKKSKKKQKWLQIIRKKKKKLIKV